ncbi:MAG: transposase, partial [Bdellovibrionota bacterium]
MRENAPQAVHVWDRFHLMQLFEEAVNDTRKSLHEDQPQSSEIRRLSRGKYRFLFVKKAKRRTEEEKTHVDEVLNANRYFMRLELIKERMLTFFDQPDEASAKTVFEEIGDWIWQSHFKPLMAWYQRFEQGWKTAANYFKYRVSSA